MQQGGNSRSNLAPKDLFFFSFQGTGGLEELEGGRREKKGKWVSQQRSTKEAEGEDREKGGRGIQPIKIATFAALLCLPPPRRPPQETERGKNRGNPTEEMEFLMEGSGEKLEREQVEAKDKG